MRTIAIVGLLLLGSTWALSTAMAQDSSSGAITGTVYDQNGAPIRGVRVVAKSDTHIGARAVYTDAEGFFRFAALSPGVFEVAASAPKLRTIVQRGIKVGINAGSHIDIVMEVETETEQVKVVEKAPIVTTTKAGVKETFDAEFVANMPLEWRTDVEGFVGHNTAGATFKDNRTIRIAGGGTGQNSFTVDGFTTNAMTQTMKSLAAFEIQTAGYGAEHASTPGGVVSVVTKSGSNRYEFDLTAFHEDSKLRFFTDELDVNERSWNTFINPTIAGPIVKDRLWFFVNMETRSEIGARERHSSGLLPDPPARKYNNIRPTAKLTWQIAPRHKLQSLMIFNRSWIRNAHSTASRTAEAQEDRQYEEWLTGLTWEALLGDNLFFKSQVGLNRMYGQNMPMICLTEGDNCLDIPRVQQTFPISYDFGNNDRANQNDSWNLEIVNQLEWFLDTRRFGHHAIKIKSRVHNNQRSDGSLVPGDYYLRYNGTVLDRKITTFSNDPRTEPGRFGWRFFNSQARQTVTSLHDTWRATKYLTITPGVGLVMATASATNSPGEQSFTAVTPHIGVAWDATHDGRTALKASFNQYVDPTVNRIATFLAGSAVREECRWNATTQVFDNCTYAGGNTSRTIGSPCGPTGLRPDGTSCIEKLKAPRTWEYTAGAEREVTQGVAVGTDVVYRFYDNQFEDRETNRVWSPSGLTTVPSGEYRDGKNRTIEDIGTPDNAERRYISASLSLHKREGRFRLTSAYTWARLWGRSDDSRGVGELGVNPAQDLYYLNGYLPDDVRHALKTSAVYQFTNWLSLGVTHRYYSGRPYDRKYRNDVLGNFGDYRARLGTDPGANINDPGDDRQLRLPDQMQLNFQVRANLKSLIGQDLELWTDALNVLALRTTTAVSENDGLNWGGSAGRMEPFRLRVGLRYRY
jgi:hypothetical protein